MTLAWTDPPGDPAAAIKLVNGLDLVVTNLDDPTNPVVYYGNDIPARTAFQHAGKPDEHGRSWIRSTTSKTSIIPQPLGTNYTVTVFGREVNVNAVSAQTNSYNNANPSGVYAPNVVQDYALVISCGESGAPAAFTVTDNGILSNPTGGQDITVVTTTNSPLFNQFVGASSPVLNTNTVSFTANTTYGGAAQDTLGMTNQWHFYIVTNNARTAAEAASTSPTPCSSSLRRRRSRFRAWASLRIRSPTRPCPRRTLTFLWRATDPQDLTNLDPS